MVAGGALRGQGAVCPSQEGREPIVELSSPSSDRVRGGRDTVVPSPGQRGERGAEVRIAALEPQLAADVAAVELHGRA
jgi:hypothetical protein